jgi:hypothetical protein
MVENLAVVAELDGTTSLIAVPNPPWRELRKAIGTRFCLQLDDVLLSDAPIMRIARYELTNWWKDDGICFYLRVVDPEEIR